MARARGLTSPMDSPGVGGWRRGVRIKEQSTRTEKDVNDPRRWLTDGSMFRLFGWNRLFVELPECQLLGEAAKNRISRVIAGSRLSMSEGEKEEGKKHNPERPSGLLQLNGVGISSGRRTPRSCVLWILNGEDSCQWRHHLSEIISENETFDWTGRSG